MNDWESTELPDELGDVASRLRQNRHQSMPLELDELKRRALTQATRAERAPRGGLRGRLATVLLVLGLSASVASAGVIAGTSTSKSRPSASISQYESGVLPEQILPASARLASRSGCPRAAFIARVTGQNILRVVFRLDGKVIKTVSARRARTSQNGRFTVRIDPNKLSVGVHRLTARVTFRAATKRKPRTLRIAVVRCARRVVAPRFTG